MSCRNLFNMSFANDILLFYIEQYTEHICYMCNNPEKFSFSKWAKQWEILTSVGFELTIRRGKCFSSLCCTNNLAEWTDHCSECSWSLSTSYLRPYINHYYSILKDLILFLTFKNAVISISKLFLIAKQSNGIQGL